MSSCRRTRKRSIYLDAEDVEDDNEFDDETVYCPTCDSYKHGICDEHPVRYIMDKRIDHKTPPEKRARATCPPCLQIKKSNIAGQGVWTRLQLPTNVVFGPYMGRFTSDKQSADASGYAWQIRTQDRCYLFVDAGDDCQSNWLRFVNSARVENEQNLTAFQYQGNIYYRTYKSIPANTELLVYYGYDYGTTLRFTSPTEISEEQCLPYRCEKCSKRFSSEKFFHYHLAQVHKEGKSGIKRVENDWTDHESGDDGPNSTKELDPTDVISKTSTTNLSGLARFKPTTCISVDSNEAYLANAKLMEPADTKVVSGTSKTAARRGTTRSSPGSPRSKAKLKNGSNTSSNNPHNRAAVVGDHPRSKCHRKQPQPPPAAAPPAAAQLGNLGALRTTDAMELLSALGDWSEPSKPAPPTLPLRPFGPKSAHKSKNPSPKQQLSSLPESQDIKSSSESCSSAENGPSGYVKPLQVISSDPQISGTQCHSSSPQQPDANRAIPNKDDDTTTNSDTVIPVAGSDGPDSSRRVGLLPAPKGGVGCVLGHRHGLEPVVGPSPDGPRTRTIPAKPTNVKTNLAAPISAPPRRRPSAPPRRPPRCQLVTPTANKSSIVGVVLGKDDVMTTKTSAESPPVACNSNEPSTSANTAPNENKEISIGNVHSECVPIVESVEEHDDQLNAVLTSKTTQSTHSTTDSKSVTTSAPLATATETCNQELSKPESGLTTDSAALMSTASISNLQLDSSTNLTENTSGETLNRNTVVYNKTEYGPGSGPGSVVQNHVASASRMSSGSFNVAVCNDILESNNPGASTTSIEPSSQFLPTNTLLNSVAAAFKVSQERAGTYFADNTPNKINQWHAQHAGLLPLPSNASNHGAGVSSGTLQSNHVPASNNMPSRLQNGPTEQANSLQQSASLLDMTPSAQSPTVSDPVYTNPPGPGWPSKHPHASSLPIIPHYAVERTNDGKDNELRSNWSSQHKTLIQNSCDQVNLHTDVSQFTQSPYPQQPQSNIVQRPLPKALPTIKDAFGSVTNVMPVDISPHRYLPRVQNITNQHEQSITNSPLFTPPRAVPVIQRQDQARTTEPLLIPTVLPFSPAVTRPSVITRHPFLSPIAIDPILELTEHSAAPPPGFGRSIPSFQQTFLPSVAQCYPPSTIPQLQRPPGLTPITAGAAAADGPTASILGSPGQVGRATCNMVNPGINVITTNANTSSTPLASIESMLHGPYSVRSVNQYSDISDEDDLEAKGRAALRPSVTIVHHGSTWPQPSAILPPGLFPVSSVQQPLSHYLPGAEVQPSGEEHCVRNTPLGDAAVRTWNDSAPKTQATEVRSHNDVDRQPVCTTGGCSERDQILDTTLSVTGLPTSKAVADEQLATTAIPRENGERLKSDSEIITDLPPINTDDSLLTGEELDLLLSPRDDQQQQKKAETDDSETKQNEAEEKTVPFKTTKKGQKRKSEGRYKNSDQTKYDSSKYGHIHPKDRLVGSKSAAKNSPKTTPTKKSSSDVAANKPNYDKNGFNLADYIQDNKQRKVAKLSFKIPKKAAPVPPTPPPPLEPEPSIQYPVNTAVVAAPSIRHIPASNGTSAAPRNIRYVGQAKLSRPPEHYQGQNMPHEESPHARSTPTQPSTSVPIVTNSSDRTMEPKGLVQNHNSPVIKDANEPSNQDSTNCNLPATATTSNVNRVFRTLPSAEHLASVMNRYETQVKKPATESNDRTTITTHQIDSADSLKASTPNYSNFPNGNESSSSQHGGDNQQQLQDYEYANELEMHEGNGDEYAEQQDQKQQKTAPKKPRFQNETPEQRQERLERTATSRKINQVRKRKMEEMVRARNNRRKYESHSGTGDDFTGSAKRVKSEAGVLTPKTELGEGFNIALFIGNQKGGCLRLPKIPKLGPEQRIE